jgi:hypothetical protein
VTTAPSEYLVQYGRPAFVGRFGYFAGGSLARGDQVVVRSLRGSELGTVLCEAAARFAHLLGPAADGELLRTAGPDDLSLTERLADLGRNLLAAADRVATANGVSVTFLDAEVFLDGESAVLHAVAWGDADLTPLLDAVSRECGLTVRLHDAARMPVAKDAPESHGCGKPGCGSGAGGCSSCGTGGGCSSGSCSRGSVKTADELTAYFADLRVRMDAHFGGQRTPLN